MSRIYQLLATALVVLLCGCRPPLQIVEPLVQRSSTPDAKHIVVVKSSDNPLFNDPIRTFTSQSSHRITIVTLGESLFGSANSIRNLEPDLLFLLGFKATVLAREQLSDIPAVFAMNPGYENQFAFSDAAFCGVSLETPATNEFIQFKLVMPELSKVIVFYDPEISAAAMKNAQEELVAIGIQLERVSVHNLADIQRAYHARSDGTNGIWLQVDATVMNREAFAFLKERSYSDHIPLFASFSEQFAKEGAVASVSLDLSAIGSQISILADQLLDGENIHPSRCIQTPIGGRLTVNLEAARKVGITIPDEALSSVSDIIDVKNQETAGE